MKKRELMLAMVCGLMLAGLTSCYTDDDWYPGPGPNGFNFNDQRLRGYWELVQYNSYPVDADDTNYMYFNGDGWGRYYYLQNGRPYEENTRYWCQNAVSGNSYYQININYEYSDPVTMNYWFTHSDNTLWMQWTTYNGRVQTYVYDRVGGVPW